MLQPSFEIDSTGRVLCKSHTYYDILKEVPLESDFLGHMGRDKALNCSKCDHYRDDDCYFPKSEINKIKREMGYFRRGIRCEICGNRIHLIFNILHKFQSKELLNVNLGMVCCECYHTMKDPNHNSVVSIFKIGISIFFLTNLMIFMIATLPLMFQAPLLEILFLSIIFIMAAILTCTIISNFKKIIKRHKFKKRMRSWALLKRTCRMRD